MHTTDRHNAYMIITGVVLGILVGPWVLGRWAPGAYQRLFVGDRDARQQLEAFDRRNGEKRQQLADTGVTEAALTEYDRQQEPRRQVLDLRVQLAKLSHASRFFGQTVAVLLVVALVLVWDRFSIRQDRRNRLATVRNALIAVWIAMVLAGPAVNYIPVVFTVLLVLLAATAVLVPGKPSDLGDGS